MHVNRKTKLKLITKVSNFDVEVFVKKKVFWLEVSVDDHVTMTIIHTRDDLLEKPTSFRLFQLSTKKTNSSNGP